MRHDSSRFYSVDIYMVLKTMCVFAEVSYIPEKVVARPGENVTVYCVFNDHHLNASTALWILNFNQQLDHSQFHPVNQWVSCRPPSLPGSPPGHSRKGSGTQVT